VRGIHETVERLAKGSLGRTEADIQSDVRKFLLDAPFELEADEVVDVALEAPVHGGGRIDIEVGFAVIEVKKSLSSPRTLADAKVQLRRYVRRRTEERGQRYVGLLTDGRVWILFHLDNDGDLAEVARFTVTGAQDATALAAWLEPVLATTRQIAPTPGEIKRRLGAESAAVQLDLADLRTIYNACRELPEVQLKRELWARLLLSALGTNFENSDELFVMHTYLVLTAELIAHEILNMPISDREGDLREILEGQQFELAGLHGVVEADFFDWPVTIAAGTPVVRAMLAACRVSRGLMSTTTSSRSCTSRSLTVQPARGSASTTHQTGLHRRSLTRTSPIPWGNECLIRRVGPARFCSGPFDGQWRRVRKQG